MLWIILLSLCCIPALALDLKINGGNFQRIGSNVSGKCTAGADSSWTVDQGSLTASNYTYLCTRDLAPQTDLNDAHFGATVTQNSDNVEFSDLTTEDIKVVNIWCGNPTVGTCVPVIFYEIEASETDEGYQCELKFAADMLNDGFRRPKKATWKVNGNELKKDVTKVLVASDFTSENEGKVKSFVYKINLPDDDKAGTYSCEFEFEIAGNVDGNIISAQIGSESAPIDVYWRVSPEKDQFKDGDNVNISCAFTGTPVPVITWKFKGEPFEGTPEVSAEGNRHISTIQLTDIEDSEDKGEYSCTAVNSEGTGQTKGLLHVRDKLAPLWPFIGIVVQVIVLAVCIYFGEKIRKSKYAEKQRAKQTDDDKETRT